MPLSVFVRDRSAGPHPIERRLRIPRHKKQNQSPDAPADARRATIAWAVVLVALSLITLVAGVEQAFHFQGSPMDGPLQLYNALRRIAAGQRPGVDFQFFHGMGVPFLHYLPFRLFGGTFGAAEVTRQTLTTVAYPLVLIAFFRAFTGDWRRTLALSSIVMATSIALRLSTILVAINSLLGVRSLFATMVPIAWYALRESRWRTAATGILLGLAVLTGTEQGLAALAAFVVIACVLAARSPAKRTATIDVVGAPIIAIATVTTLLTLVGGISGMRGALRYNLKLLPGDQYWYFGAPPNSFISSWSSAIELLGHEPVVLITIIAAAWLLVANLRRLARAADDALRARYAALSMLCLYGLASCASMLGIFLVGYAQPCQRVVLLVGALELASALDWQMPRAGIWSRRSPIVAALVAVTFMLVSVPVVVFQSIMLLPHVVGSHVFAGEGVVLEGMWPRALAVGDAVVARAKLTPTTPVWSTYAGLLETKHGMFNPSFDYIIHALGNDNRDAYARRFAEVRPQIVQTVLPQFSPYEMWLEQTSWSFYRELLANYRAVTATPWSIFWERTGTTAPAPIPVLDSPIAAGQDSVVLALPPAASSPPAPVLIEVELTYRAVNPLASLPMFGGLPRYLVSLEGAITRGPVTLNPHVTTSTFPVILLQGGRPTLRFSTRSLLPGAHLEVSRVRVLAHPVTPEIAPWLQNVIAAEVAATTARDE